MKLLHNDKMALAWAIFIELVAHGFFAIQAFLLGGFLGEIALKGVMSTQLANWVGSIMLAVFIGGAAFQAFVLGEYMREHVESFESTAKGNGSYMKSWQQLRFAVAAMELSSLAFRCVVVYSQGDWQQALITAAFGVFVLWYAFAQAKVIHASVNRPVEYDVARMHQETGRSIVQESLKLIPKMSTTDKQKIYNGDLSPVDEQYGSNLQKQQEKLRPKEEQQAKERERQQKQREDLAHGRGLMGRLLGPKAPESDLAPFQTTQDNGTNHLSRNGRN